jgi:putative tryptophan/tyrosine transport system substrate-binding protein
MDRRAFLGGLAGLAAPVAAGAQQTRTVARIGMLLSGVAPPPGQPSPFVDAFRGGLRELGYIEGQHVVIDYRWSEGAEQRFSDLASDLVRLNVAVIVTQGTPAARAAKAATSTIPIVMTSVGDPVGAGLVASLARPGANVTGLSLLDTELDGKRIELLKQGVPGLTRLAILWSANDPGSLPDEPVVRAAVRRAAVVWDERVAGLQLAATRTAARLLDIAVQSARSDRRARPMLSSSTRYRPDDRRFSC